MGRAGRSIVVQINPLLSTVSSRRNVSSYCNLFAFIASTWSCYCLPLAGRSWIFKLLLSRSDVIKLIYKNVQWSSRFSRGAFVRVFTAVPPRAHTWHISAFSFVRWICISLDRWKGRTVGKFKTVRERWTVLSGPTNKLNANETKK